MFCVLSRSSETSCGDSRGVSSLFNLPQCLDSIESHLSLIHFSKESVTERKLILAKVSLFDVEDPVMASLRKAYIMHTYGKFWRQRSACQYATHPGSDSEGAKSRYSVNLEMSKAISKICGVLIQVGSGRNKWFKISGWFQPISFVFFQISRLYINPLFLTSIYLYQLTQQAQCFCEGNTWGLFGIHRERSQWFLRLCEIKEFVRIKSVWYWCMRLSTLAEIHILFPIKKCFSSGNSYHTSNSSN